MRFNEFVIENVNSAVFKRGFKQTKTIDTKKGEITLVATHGNLPYIPGKKSTISDQFRIEAFANEVSVAWVNFEIVSDHLEAIDVVVTPNYRRLGIATEMYNFARELHNDVLPSSKQTPDGKAFWAGQKVTEDMSEDAINDAAKEVAELIMKNCKPFLRSINFPNNGDNWLFRGLDRNTAPGDSDAELRVRKDRKPKDTALGLHNIVDQWMLKKFKWRPRSEGLFAIGSPSYASDFGNVHIIFPIGNFKSVWSSNIRDMTLFLTRIAGTPSSDEDKDDVDYSKFKTKIQQGLSKAEWAVNAPISEYLATAKNKEIIIGCDSYYAIPLYESYYNKVTIARVIAHLKVML